jgi:hypothetical protein
MFREAAIRIATAAVMNQSNSHTPLDPATLMACEILFKKQLPRDFRHCDLLPNEGKVRGVAEMVQVAARDIGIPLRSHLK